MVCPVACSSSGSSRAMTTTRAAIRAPKLRPVTTRVALMASGVESTPQETMQAPKPVRPTTTTQRVPIRRMSQPAMTSPGISASAATPNESATSDG